MTSRWAFLIPLAALAACAQSTPESRGAATFQAFGCVKCHSVGYGGGAYGPDLTTVGFRKSREWLDTWLRNPHAWKDTTVMPNFNLNESIRGDLVAFLSQQKGQAWGGKRPWDAPELQGDLVKKGGVLFDKAGCVACHGQRGKGGLPNNNVIGGLIPPLEKVSEGYSKEELRARIANGRFSDPADPSQPPPMLFMPAWKDVLKDEDFTAVIEFLYSIAPAKGADEF